jgi:hypothetical protein
MLFTVITILLLVLGIVCVVRSDHKEDTFDERELERKLLRKALKP